ncbi:hypothetical protein TNCV_4155291 [Trichonephila clavipes]|nr:hypothetical protein TNCV_4155291 [Trichonephila clavipes]
MRTESPGQLLHWYHSIRTGGANDYSRTSHHPFWDEQLRTKGTGSAFGGPQGEKNRFGEPLEYLVLSGPRIINTADTAVATPLWRHKYDAAVLDEEPKRIHNGDIRLLTMIFEAIREDDVDERHSLVIKQRQLVAQRRILGFPWKVRFWVQKDLTKGTYLISVRLWIP